MTLLKEGQVVRDTYEVERYLGEGAFAEVYRVKHPFFGRLAMKVFKRIGTLGETRQMLGEAVMLSKISHPNIIRVFDANTVETSEGTRGFFTMEYVAGGSLERFWVSYRDRFIPVETAVDILLQVCQGLAAAHEERPPIVHRDVKPQNILVGYDPGGLRAKLTDFGLAKRADPFNHMVSARGTLVFKAPETLRNPRHDSRAGDVWALGTTAYLLLTDHVPYDDPGGAESIIGRQFSRAPLPPSRFHRDVDPDLDRIVLSTLEPRLEDRPASARELAEELTRWKADRTPRLLPTASAPPSRTSKDVLGRPSPADADAAEKMARRALQLARQANTLQEAADLMEEAFNKSPELRERYQHKLRLWRNGVMM